MKQQLPKNDLNFTENPPRVGVSREQNHIFTISFVEWSGKCYRDGNVDTTAATVAPNETKFDIYNVPESYFKTRRPNISFSRAQKRNAP